MAKLFIVAVKSFTQIFSTETTFQQPCRKFPLANLLAEVMQNTPSKIIPFSRDDFVEYLISRMTFEKMSSSFGGGWTTLLYIPGICIFVPSKKFPRHYYFAFVYLNHFKGITSPLDVRKVFSVDTLR